VAEWTRTYRFAMSVMRPFSAWGRLEVEGTEVLPEEGPVLLAGNHDSYYDPVMIGFAARRRRQVHALAKSELWKVPVLSKVLDGMGQIPIDRGAGDAHALDRAIERLRAGACIGVFPEGTRSRGEELRARSGIGRLALAVPEAKLVLVAIAGTTDFVGTFPRRPTVRARFFEPAGGQTDPGEAPEHLAARLLAEIRAEVPVAALGRPSRRSRRI
jgi:1-acyl-sn-glycerol-3-phosphate acyltransferase